MFKCESLYKLVINNLGDFDQLEKFKVVVGGDQLTAVRFDGAAALRLFSPTPIRRLEHLKPIICELWHLKQDFLEVRNSVAS